jgi:hypothetical protein
MKGSGVQNIELIPKKHRGLRYPTPLASPRPADVRSTRLHVQRRGARGPTPPIRSPSAVKFARLCFRSLSPSGMTSASCRGQTPGPDIPVRPLTLKAMLQISRRSAVGHECPTAADRNVRSPPCVFGSLEGAAEAEDGEGSPRTPGVAGDSSPRCTPPGFRRLGMTVSLPRRAESWWAGGSFPHPREFGTAQPCPTARFTCGANCETATQPCPTARFTCGANCETATQPCPTVAGWTRVARCWSTTVGHSPRLASPRPHSGLSRCGGDGR